MSVFANAFSGGVWAALIFLLVVGTLALSFVLRRENKLPHDASYAAKARLHKIRNAGIEADQQKIIELQERWDLSEILLVVVGAICQQGCARDPSTSASRILYLSLLFLATLVITAFSAVLVAGVSTQTATCFVGEESKDRPSLLTKTVTSVISSNTSDFSLENEIPQNTFPRHTGALNDERSMSNKGLVHATESGRQKSLSHNSTGTLSFDDHLSQFFEAKRVLTRAQLKELEFGLTKRNHLLQMDSTWNQLACSGSEIDSDSAGESLSINLSDVWPAVAQWIGGLAIALCLLIAELISSRGVLQKSRRSDSTPTEPTN